MTPNSPIEQWTVIMSQSEATPTPTPSAAPAASDPKIELTINTKSTPAEAEPPTVEKKDCTCGSKPKDYISSDEEYTPPRNGRGRRRRHRDAPIIRVHSRSRSPIRYTPPTVPINSSSDMLASAKDFDGVMELPFPARSSAYMVTFPFTDTDVRKWTWLFRRGVFDKYMSVKKAGERYGDEEDEDDVFEDEWGVPVVTREWVPHRRSRSPVYHPDAEMPKVFLSRALDTEVVPEEKKDVRYWIVVKQWRSNNTVKLMCADSRKAAGIMIYYEALSGNSIPFVGAVAADFENKKLKGKKFVKVENLEELTKTQEAGDADFGIVC